MSGNLPGAKMAGVRSNYIFSNMSHNQRCIYFIFGVNFWQNVTLFFVVVKCPSMQLLEKRLVKFSFICCKFVHFCNLCTFVTSRNSGSILHMRLLCIKIKSFSMSAHDVVLCCMNDVINRPGVAGPVLHTASLFIESVSLFHQSFSLALRSHDQFRNFHRSTPPPHPQQQQQQ